ncbi:ATP-binding protein [Nocardia sp. NEAU-G5]|uniref:ATP-binding protein n=1 Tax=Nocardia albiluteola TaxID=2842303 RepID=A0ABS6BCC6_9NOCA|nr:DEAD/DEAH box helicase [Nocardia albiluteola]MBU3067938.1 ATP-binding protein [Nocardia albiluteola]
MRGPEHAAQLVRFWQSIEMFSPQEVPAPSPRTNRPSSPFVLDMPDDDVPPWHEDHWIHREMPLPEDKTWRFTVYGGIFDVQNVCVELARVFGDDGVQPDGRRAGPTAMFAFTLDAQGTVVADSSVLSACAWAMSRLRDPGPNARGWLHGFGKDAAEFSDAVDKLAVPSTTNSDPGPGPLSRAGAAVAERGRAGAAEALIKGAGAAATAAATAGATAVGGPIVGGIAGKAAGAFVEKVLERKPAQEDSGDAEAGAPAAPTRYRFTTHDLHDFVKQLGDGLEITENLGVQGVRVQCRQIATRYADDDGGGDHTFLNSYIAEDLERVESAVRAGTIGAALRDYLSDTIADSQRVDVRTNRDAILSGVAPTMFPGGRWPGALSRPLVLGQQFAVNRMMTEIGGTAGIFAVNGPPGTGKTTMLRDALAGLVVQRAERLAELDHPRNAFTDRLGQIDYQEDRGWSVRGLRPELTGFEILLATAGNKAAENVTAEIPALAAVAGARAEAVAIDYFTEIATRMRNGDAWGLAAAVLGNMGKRRQFISRFWFGDDPRQERQPSSGEQEQPVSDDEGMLRVLQRAANGVDAPPDWATAVREFRDARAEVHRLAAERQVVADAVAELPRLEAAIREAQSAIDAADIEHSRWREQHRIATDTRDAASHALEQCTDDISLHNQSRPGFWILLSTLFRAGRTWSRRSEELADTHSAAREKLSLCEAEVARCTAGWSTAAETGRRCVQDHRAAVADARRHADLIDEARENWPTTVPFGEAIADEDRFQLLNAWSDEEFTAARQKLFLQALTLHKAFALNAAGPLRSNLGAAMTLIGNKVRNTPATEVVLAAWQALFLVVPMVSTTFASLPRLFADLTSESLGWLFIDEAGQATPQQAVGGLWRTRRAVIVGDPQQLEPVVTLPVSAQRALLEHHRVDHQWLPDSTSVQRVSDRLARFGTMLAEPEGDGRFWVGAPLRVHRRCDRPMFEVSNRIAYGGDLMVFGTPDRQPFVDDDIWFDIRSNDADGNWVHAEGRQLHHLLDMLRNGMGLPANSIRVISPFRDVVRGAKTVARQTIGHSFANDNVGTVHTVQGQESDVVILVLGTPPHKGGARQWAAAKPNLLNVAVSRAKRRFYVIGNREEWCKEHNFSVLASFMKTQAGEM